MKLESLVLFFPGAFMGMLAKTIRTRIPEVTKDYIEQEHLYHLTGEKETANLIKESRLYKTSNRNFKKFEFIWKSSIFYVCR